MPLLLLVLQLLAAHGAGWLVLRAARVEPALRQLAPVERIVLRWVAGVGATGIVAFGLVHAHVVHAGAMAAGLLALAALGAWSVWSTRADFRPRGIAWRDPLDALGAGVFVAASLLLLVLCWNPLLLIDTYAYHLTFQKQFLLHGGATPTPYNLHGLFHHVWELHTLWGLALAPWDVIAPKCLQAFSAIATAALVASVARRAGHRGAGWWAACAWLLSQQTIQFAPSCHIDVAVALCAALGAVLCARALDSGPRPRRQLLLLAGAVLGMCGAVKTSGLYYATLLAGTAAVLCAWRWRTVAFARGKAAAGRMARADVLAGLLAGLVLLAVVSPWLARNAITSGNPLIPFATTVFPMKTEFDEITRDFRADYGDFDDTSPMDPGFYPALASRFVHAIRVSIYLDQAKLILAGVLGVLLCALWRDGRRRGGWYLVIAAALLLPSAIISPAWRFAFSAVAVGLMAAALGLGEAAARVGPRLGRARVVAWAALALVVLAWQAPRVRSVIHPSFIPRERVPWGLHLTRADQQAYIDAHPDSAMLRLMEVATTDDDLILSTEVGRYNLWTDRKILPLFSFHGDSILELLHDEDGHDAASAAAFLRSLGVTHVLTAPDLPARFPELVETRLERLGEASGVVLYRLLPGESGLAPTDP